MAEINFWIFQLIVILLGVAFGKWLQKWEDRHYGTK